MFELTGQTAIVTGAATGIGEAIARRLARAGATIAVADMNAEGAQAVAASIGGESFGLSIDISRSDSVNRAVGDVLKQRARIDILVNNAGLNVRKPALEITWDEWNLVLDTNLRGEFFVAQAVARDSMIPRKCGRIINIGSVTSVFGYAGLTPYCASRGGVKQMTMSLADDWGKYGITVNCLAPGWFKTSQNAVLYENKEWLEYIVDRIPMRRPGAPQDLDGAVVFLASDASAYFTGQTMLVDGGISTGATRATVAAKQS